jgi:hypothetical protein
MDSAWRELLTDLDAYVGAGVSAPVSEAAR